MRVEGGQHAPADQSEPGEAVVEGVAARQRLDAVFGRRRREVGLVVVHLTHQFEALSGNNDKYDDVTMYDGICLVCVD